MSNPRIEIPAFPEGKRFAATFSFDDGDTCDRRIIAAFNQWGLKATFNLNSGLLQHTGQPAVEKHAGPGGHVKLDASEVAALYQGHEVAIHASTHPWLERLSESEVVDEVLGDRKALEDLVGYPVRGMAYPFGTYSPRVIAILRSLGIVYSRTTQNAEVCFPPAEPLAWPSTSHQFAENPTVPERFKAWLENPRQQGVFFVWGHGFEFQNRQEWEALERIYKPLAGHAEVWYCTNIQLFDYETARQRLVIAANRKTAFNPSGIPVWVNVDGKLQAIPAGATVAL
jgi:peptidoglycan-N-acetylglucosamine deacetylase